MELFSHPTGIFLLMMAVPLGGGIAGWLSREPRVILARAEAGIAATIFLIFALTVALGSSGTLSTPDGWFRVDTLSSFHLVALSLVFTTATLFSRHYFLEEILDGHLRAADLRLFSLLWGATMSSMILTLVSNNLGLMWVGMEATTLLTAFMISLRSTKSSLEALWKYLMICSVGIGFAFIGTILTGNAATGLRLAFKQELLWSELFANARNLDPMTMKAAFLFVLIGFGTKAGLAPMHNWLPDAHSQAPAPVSALFSGFMLSCAIYCLMRYIPLVEGATGNHGWTNDLLRLFGLLSLAFAAIFIMFQRDLKRLLAYSSVEHMGIVTLGLSLGLGGTFAALLHTLNHSLAKPLAFCSAGRLGQIFGSHEINRIRGCSRVAPLWGFALFASIGTLLGFAPMGMFMSELLVTRAAINSSNILVAIVFLALVFLVLAIVLRHLIEMTWGVSEVSTSHQTSTQWREYLLVGLPIVLLLLTGLTSLRPIIPWFESAARIIRGVS